MAWRAGTIPLFLLGSLPPKWQFKNTSTGFDPSVLRLRGFWGEDDQYQKITKTWKKEFEDLDVKGVSVVEASLGGVSLQGDEGQVTLGQRARAQLHTVNQSFKDR